MSERLQRIVRTASEAAIRVQTASTAESIQQEWETFLIAWRRAIEILNDLAEQSGYSTLKATMHAEREASAALTYAWEARNAEYHSATGSSEQTAVTGFALVATDPKKPLYIEHLSISDGKIRISPGCHNISPEILGGINLKPVTTKSKRTPIVEPPAGFSHGRIARQANAFLLAYAQALRL